MTLYVLELGFDTNMTNIQGSDVFQPLQYGLRYGEGRDQGKGGWLTALEERDRIQIRIFDITLLSGGQPGPSPSPKQLALQFLTVAEGKAASHPPSNPTEPYGGTFTNGVLAFDAGQLASIGERHTPVFGAGRQTLPAWQLVYPAESATPATIHVVESLYKLSVVLTVDDGARFAFDPEWVVDPYGGG